MESEFIRAVKAALKRFAERTIISPGVESARENKSTSPDTSKDNSAEKSPRRLKKVEGDDWIWDYDASKATGLTLDEIRKHAKTIYDTDAELSRLMFADINNETGEFENYCFQPPVINAIVDRVQREIEEVQPPPNLYVDGKIKACGTVLDYADVSKWTRRPLPIFRNHFVSSERCSLKSKKYSERAFICRDCKERFGGKEVRFGNGDLNCREIDYIFHCHGIGAKYRHDFTELGLEPLIDVLYLGVDDLKGEVVFPLTYELYTTIPLKDLRERTQRAKILLAHYNRALVKRSDGTIEGTCFPYEFRQSCAAMPYVDNRIYSTDGRIIYAYCAGLKKDYQPTLPFEPST